MPHSGWGSRKSNTPNFRGSFQANAAPFSAGSTSAHPTLALVARVQGGITLGPDGGELAGVLNFTRAAIYAARVPERWYPKRFDIWGSSHQIMHVLVVLGAISQERGLLRAMKWWSEGGRGLCKSAIT
jgi:Haemolysin-III related